MKVELDIHDGFLYNGEYVQQDQWRVFATGANGNRVLVGYLSFKPELAFMHICPQPDNVMKELLEKMEAITGRKVLPPYPLVEPPVIDNDAGEDEYEETEDEEDDN